MTLCGARVVVGECCKADKRRRSGFCRETTVIVEEPYADSLHAEMCGVIINIEKKSPDELSQHWLSPITVVAWGRNSMRFLRFRESTLANILSISAIMSEFGFSGFSRFRLIQKNPLSSASNEPRLDDTRPCCADLALATWEAKKDTSAKSKLFSRFGFALMFSAR